MITVKNQIDYTFKQLGNVGIFHLIGELTSDHEDELKLLLMRAVHSIDRAVVNLKKVSGIDRTCLNLLRKAYCTSMRLRQPIILTEVPGTYASSIFNCDTTDSTNSNLFKIDAESSTA